MLCVHVVFSAAKRKTEAIKGHTYGYAWKRVDATCFCVVCACLASSQTKDEFGVSLARRWRGEVELGDLEGVLRLPGKEWRAAHLEIGSWVCRARVGGPVDVGVDLVWCNDYPKVQCAGHVACSRCCFATVTRFHPTHNQDTSHTQASASVNHANITTFGNYPPRCLPPSRCLCLPGGLFQRGNVGRRPMMTTACFFAPRSQAPLD